MTPLSTVSIKYAYIYSWRTFEEKNSSNTVIYVAISLFIQGQRRSLGKLQAGSSGAVCHPCSVSALELEQA